MSDHVFDVIVIGAGPAGASAAFCLARGGKKVALLDRLIKQEQSPAYIKVGESVPAAINHLLQTMHLQPVDAIQHRPIPGSDSFWGGEHLQLDFIQHAQGMSWRLDRIAFEQALLQQAIGQGVQFFLALLDNLHHDGATWQIKTTGAECLQSEFIIDASGRAALVARKLGVQRIKGPPLVALWAVGEASDTAAENLTAQTLTESQPEGWWYAAHLPSGCPLAIFHTSAKYAAEIRRQPQKWWQQFDRTHLLKNKLNAHGLQRAELKAHEARTIILQQTHGDYWAACGDAALGFDPISSQGIFNALASSHMVSQALLSTDRQRGLQEYHDRLQNIADIYQQRRLQYYRRAYGFYGTGFWEEQTSVLTCCKT